jgi:hypothetical protein
MTGLFIFGKTFFKRFVLLLNKIAYRVMTGPGNY